MSFRETTFRGDCKNSYCDPHHKYTVTGDLRFISACKLQKLLSEGPNYCENKKFNYKKCKESIENRFYRVSVF